MMAVVYSTMFYLWDWVPMTPWFSYRKTHDCGIQHFFFWNLCVNITRYQRLFFEVAEINAHVLSWGSDDDLHSRFVFPWYILVHWFSVGNCADDARNTWWNSLMTIPMNESRCYIPSRCSLACEVWDSSIEGQLPEICCPKVPRSVPYISRLVSGSSKATWLFEVAWEWHQ